MQKITSDTLVSRAKELLSSGTVNKVIGWGKGDFCYDVTPKIFNDEKSLDEFVFDGFCGSNLSKYLVSKTASDNSKFLVFLKPCDTYSMNQLITEHRIDREKLYIIGVACGGMLDDKVINSKCGAFTSVTDNGDSVTVHTLYNGDVTKSRDELLPDRCINCKSKKHVIFDELIGVSDNDDAVISDRFSDVKRLEAMTPDERFKFWQGELSRCIRCNACRDVCPACTCEKCVFDNPASGVENKAPSDSFEEKMFHIIRAFHVAGRCTDCGECSRVCPQHIPLHLLNRKFISDINNFYGEYQAGEVIGNRSPLTEFRTDDIEPADAVKGGDKNA